MPKATIKIEGMHCAACASNVEKSLSKIDGVGEISVNAVVGKAFAEVNDKVTKDQLKAAVKDPGFEATEIEIE